MQIISPKCNVVVEIPREWEKAPLELNDEAKLLAEPDGAVAVYVRRKPRLLPMLFKARFRRLGRIDAYMEPLACHFLEKNTPLRVRLVDVPPVFIRMRQTEFSFAVSIWAAVGPNFHRNTHVAQPSAQLEAAR